MVFFILNRPLFKMNLKGNAEVRGRGQRGFFVIFYETNLFLLSHRHVLVLKIGGTALMGGFPVGLMKRKPLFLEENCKN